MTDFERCPFYGVQCKYVSQLKTVLDREVESHICHELKLALLEAEIERLRDALQLADYTLRGCNMNLNVVERKVTAALAAQEQETGT